MTACGLSWLVTTTLPVRAMASISARQPSFLMSDAAARGMSSISSRCKAMAMVHVRPGGGPNLPHFGQKGHFGPGGWQLAGCDGAQRRPDIGLRGREKRIEGP